MIVGSHTRLLHVTRAPLMLPSLTRTVPGLAWLGACLWGAGSVAPAVAQKPVTAEGARCELPIGAHEHRLASPGRFDPAARARLDALLLRRQTATFDVTYEGFPEEAREAFEFATAIWGRFLTSEVPIRVRAQWTDLGNEFLGSAGPTLLSYSGAAPRGIEPDVWYPYALADAILGMQPEGTEEAFDITAQFNSQFDRWHFGTDSPPPNSRYDFVSVVLHELGHGLGFIGSAYVDEDGRGEIGQASDRSGVIPYVYDGLVEDAAGRSILDAATYPDGSFELGDALTSGALFFGGDGAVAAYEGERPPLFVPDPFVPGSSYSHLNDIVEQREGEALMTQSLGPGPENDFDAPGTITCGVFGDMGWPLGPGCGAIAPGPEFTASKILLYPNPTTSGSDGCIGITTGGGGTVRVEVYDLLGRRIAEGSSAVSASGVGAVDARGCAVLAAPPEDATPDSNPERLNVVIGIDAPRTPGLYLVRVQGEAFDEVRQWTVVR